MHRVARTLLDFKTAGLRGQRAQVGAAIGARVEIRCRAEYPGANNTKIYPAIVVRFLQRPGDDFHGL